MENKIKRVLPLSLTAFIILVDQITKLIIVKTIPLNTIGTEVIGDFFRLIHVRNLGAAFSLGAGMAPFFRILLMIVIPLIVIIGIIVFLIRSNEVNNVQRWLLAGIAGGGIGNVFFDRIFRPLGVVDFLDFKFYGIFGLERWPTFNIADMSTVISAILLMGTLFIESMEKKKSVGQV